MSNPSPTGVSILMPSYNVGSAIAPNIERVAAIVAEWEDTQIVVIDDGSTDDTRSWAQKVATDPDIIVVGYDLNRGKGGALKEGFRYATGETIVFLDSDLDLPPEQLPGFLDAFYSSQTDVLVGAKLSTMERGRYPVLRRWLSVAFAAVNRVLFHLPIPETQTGLKVFRRTALEATLPVMETIGYAFDLELLVRIHRAGGTMATAPVKLSHGAAGRVSIAMLMRIGWDTLKIWVRSFSWK